MISSCQPCAGHEDRISISRLEKKKRRGCTDHRLRSILCSSQQYNRDRERMLQVILVHHQLHRYSTWVGVPGLEILASRAGSGSSLPLSHCLLLAYAWRTDVRKLKTMLLLTGAVPGVAFRHTAPITKPGLPEDTIYVMDAAQSLEGCGKGTAALAWKILLAQSMDIVSLRVFSLDGVDCLLHDCVRTYRYLHMRMHSYCWD